jgi:tRNA (guanosine-2'-O-)-methyltransferase
MESIYHRHNTSAILRSADSFGIMDVHLTPGDIDPSRGPSRGVKRWLNLHDHPTTGDAIQAIKTAGYSLWVADFDAPPITPEEVPLDRPICLWFGAELEGVSPEARDAADGVVTLPMRGFSQSLNVSVASALILRTVCERARQLHGERALLKPEVRGALWAQWLQRESLARGQRER